MSNDQRLARAIDGLRRQPIDGTAKALGRLAAAGGGNGRGSGEPVTAASLARARLPLFGGEVDLPVLVLREDALRRNIEGMAAYCAAAGVLHAPHGKTTMAPQIIARQLAAGAWAVSAATISQVQVYRAFGVPRVLIASQLTQSGAAEWLARELAADPDFDCYAYADSRAGVALLDEAMRAVAPGRPLRVLVELGYPGGRTGCRSFAGALEVAGAVRATGTLELAGVAGFEGGIHRDDLAGTLAAVAAFCAGLRALAEALPGSRPGGEPYVLSAGGSSFFDVVSAELTAARPGGAPAQVVIRSGAYITHDHGHYAESGPASRRGIAGPQDPRSPEFLPALELWAAVLSVPEPGLAIINAGRRDVSCDQGMPVPLRTRPGSAAAVSDDGSPAGDGGAAIDGGAAGLALVQLDDQHGYLRTPPGSRLAPGDLVCLGITHPCTTFDKWRVVPVVDAADRIIDVAHTFF